MTRHPVVPVAIAFAGGVWTASALPVPVWTLLALLPFSAGLAIACARRGRFPAAFTGAVFAFFLCGAAWYRLDSRVPAADLSKPVGEASALFRLRARVREVPLPSHEGVPEPRPGSTVVEVMTVERGGEWHPATGRVLLRIGEPGGRRAARDVFPGDVVEVLASVRRPGRARAPGDYDRREALERHGIRLEASVSPSRLRIVEEGPALSVRRQAARLRRHLATVLRRDLPRRQSELYVALLLGHRPGIDAEDRARFSESGMGHLLAVSGLHLAILAWLVGLLLRTAGVGRRSAGVTLAVFAVLYAVVAGARPPVVRAAVMVVTYLASVALGRDRDLQNTVAFAALVLLVQRPAALFEAGFQLSFAAVAFIAFLFPVIEEAWKATRGEPADWMEPLPENRYDRAMKRVRQALFVSIAAWIGVQPLVLHYLGFVNPWAILANVVVLPLATVALAGGVLLMAAGSVWVPLGTVFAVPARAGIAMLMGAVKVFAALPGSQVYLPSPGRWWLLGYYAFAFVGLVWASEGVKVLRPPAEAEYELAHTIPARWVTSSTTRRAMLGAVAVIAVAALVLAVAGRERVPAPSLTVLDVGRHRAVAVRAASGADVLVNAGSPGRASGLRDRLRENGFAPPAAVVVTRDDEERTSGLAAVLEETTGAVLALPSGTTPSGSVREARMLAHGRGVSTVWPRPGDEFSVGEGSRLTCVRVGSGDPRRLPTVLHVGAGEENAGDGLEVTFYEPATFGRSRVVAKTLRRTALPAGGVLVVLDARGEAEDLTTLARVLKPRLVIFQRSRTEAAFGGQSAAHAALVREGVQVLATEGEGTLRVEVEKGRLAVRRWKGDEWVGQ
jgi:competence protein ComEC